MPRRKLLEEAGDGRGAGGRWGVSPRAGEEGDGVGEPEGALNVLGKSQVNSGEPPCPGPGEAEVTPGLSDRRAEDDEVLGGELTVPTKGAVAKGATGRHRWAREATLGIPDGSSAVVGEARREVAAAA